MVERGDRAHRIVLRDCPPALAGREGRHYDLSGYPDPFIAVDLPRNVFVRFWPTGRFEECEDGARAEIYEPNCGHVWLGEFGNAIETCLHCGERRRREARLEEAVVPDREGLYEKYEVRRADGRPIEWCFVLEIGDPLARLAMEHYARLARREGRERLADDLMAVLYEYYDAHPEPAAEGDL